MSNDWLWGGKASDMTDEAQHLFNEAEDGMRAIGSGLGSGAGGVYDAAETVGDTVDDALLWSWCDDEDEFNRLKEA